MTLATKQVIYNPINLWVDAILYFKGNKVEESGQFFEANLDHESNVNANVPPNNFFLESYNTY